MSTVFGVPCPDCGRQMLVQDSGNLQCRSCQRGYRARMGHLFPVGEPPQARVSGPLAPAARPSPVTS